MSDESPVSPDGTEQTIETQTMVLARDGVWVSMPTSNIDGAVLLSEIVADIFA